MIVISDTSPIINLVAVGQLALLQQLYTKIIIPEAVYQEIVIEGAGRLGAIEVKEKAWFDVRSVSNTLLVNDLLLDLDLGEAEAIALAIEDKAHFLLMDERRGRTIAKKMGINVTGLLGILLVAKKRGLLTQVKPVMDDLMNKAGFWINKRLYADVLRAAKE